MQDHIHTNMNTHKYTRTHAHTHTRMHTLKHTGADMHTCTYARMHVLTLTLVCTHKEKRTIRRFTCTRTEAKLSLCQKHWEARLTYNYLPA